MKRILLSLISITFAAFSFGQNQGLQDDRHVLARYRVITETAPQTLQALQRPQLEALFFATANNPVAATTPANIRKYDTPAGAIGYCFGRAMTAHLEARKLGLATASIKKLFIVGDLRSTSQPEWRFHVTTLVKGTDDWYAIDPIVNRVLRMRDWIRYVKSVWDRSNRAKLYITDADAVLPDLTFARPIPEETGAALIELNFNPDLRRAEGIVAIPVPGVERIYSVALPAKVKYFSSVLEPEASRFNFEEIRVGADVIPYKNYFEDLMGTLLGRNPRPAFKANSSEARQLSLGAGGGGSFNLNELLR